MNDELYTKRDRMRFTKNSLSSTLAILAIIFDVLYFINIYESDVGHNVGNFYYQIRIGASIIYNLVFLLAAFLSSEGVKNYKPLYSWIMIVLGLIQVARVFILPMSAHSAVAASGAPVMGTAQFVRVLIYLIASALCLFAGAVINLNKSRALNAHIASLAQ